MMDRPLGSRYVLHDLLGRGAMGEVYRATVRGSETAVAVKLLKPELVSDPETVARFFQERSILTAIDHPNVVRVVDLVAEGDILAIVMELVQGQDLRRLLRTRQTLPPAEAVRLVGQLLDGLAAVHAAGIVHRDVKPENMLLDGAAAPQVRLTDFGVARLSYGASLTKISSIIGTPEYMAPEVADHDSAAPSADLYSAGIVLYEMLAGRTPFAGGHPLAVLRRHVEQSPPPIPGIPAPLWAQLQALLAKEPGDRPPSATQAAASLARLAASLENLPPLPLLADPAPGTWAPGTRALRTSVSSESVSSTSVSRTPAPDAWAPSTSAPDPWTLSTWAPGPSAPDPWAPGASEARMEDPAGSAAGGTVLRHRDRGDVGRPGALGGSTLWPGSMPMRMAAVPSRRKRQVRIAVLAVAAAAVLGLVTTVAMAATHRTAALTPTSSERTTLVTTSMSPSPASASAPDTGTQAAAPGSTGPAVGGQASTASGSGTSGSIVSSGNGGTGTSGTGTSKTGTSGTGTSKTGTSGTGTSGTGQAPGQVTGVTATAGDGQVVLNWQAAPGKPTGYQVEVSPAPTGGSGLLSLGAATSDTVTGLANGTMYTFTVAATSAAGNGPQSLGVTAVPVGMPVAIAAPSVTDTGIVGTSSIIEVSAQTGANTNGLVPQGYTVYEYKASSSSGPFGGTAVASEGQPWHGGPSSVPRFTVPNDGSWYEYAYTVSTAAGTSALSPLSSPIQAPVASTTTSPAVS